MRVMRQIAKVLVKNIVTRRIYALCCKVPLLRDLPVVFIDFEGLRYYATFQDIWRTTQRIEPLTREFLMNNAKENYVFLDVGAHIGIYTIRLARKVARVIALEPELRNFYFLAKNIVINNVDNKVIALPIAASDKDGYASLCIKESSAEHSLEDSSNCIRKVKVITMRIDSLLKILNIDGVDIMKIDVEGHEDKVVNGMSNLLNRNPPRILVVEISKKNLGLLKFFAEKGYKTFSLDCWSFSTCNYGFYLAE